MYAGLVETFATKPFLAGMVRKSMKRVEREVAAGQCPWESGCVDCNFVFKCCIALLFNWGGDEAQERRHRDIKRAVAELKEAESVLSSQAGEGDDVNAGADQGAFINQKAEARFVLKRLVEEERRFLSGNTARPFWKGVVEAEGQRWDRRIAAEILSEDEIPQETEGTDGSVRATRLSCAELYGRIKTAHVNAIQWCLDRVNFHFRWFCVESPVGMLMGTSTPPILEEISCLFDLEPDDKIFLPLPPAPRRKVVLLNLSLFRVTHRLFKKAGQASWRGGAPGLLFPLYPSNMLGEPSSRFEENREVPDVFVKGGFPVLLPPFSLLLFYQRIRQRRSDTKPWSIVKDPSLLPLQKYLEEVTRGDPEIAGASVWSSCGFDTGGGSVQASPGGEKVYNCGLCPKKFRGKEFVERHLNNKHPYAQAPQGSVFSSSSSSSAPQTVIQTDREAEGKRVLTQQPSPDAPAQGGGGPNSQDAIQP